MTPVRVVLRSAALIVTTALGGLVGFAQPGVPATDEIETLQQEIQGLQELRRLGVSAEQRLALSQIVQRYQQERDALSVPADAEALVEALTVVRDVLLANEEPTDEMWQAVALARGGEPGRDEGLQSLRQQAIADLAQVLTEEQQTQLALPPVDEMARNILRAFAQSARLPAQQRATMRAQLMGQVGAHLTQWTGGAKGDEFGALLQNWAERVDGLGPGAGEEAGADLAAACTAELTTLLAPDPQRRQERINGRLSQMLDEPSVPILLEDSARAMGVQP